MKIEMENILIILFLLLIIKLMGVKQYLKKLIVKNIRPLIRMNIPKYQMGFIILLGILRICLSE